MPSFLAWCKDCDDKWCFHVKQFVDRHRAGRRRGSTPTLTEADKRRLIIVECEHCEGVGCPHVEEYIDSKRKAHLRQLAQAESSTSTQVENSTSTQAESSTSTQAKGIPSLTDQK